MHPRVVVTVNCAIVIVLEHGLYDVDVCDRGIFSGELAQALTDLHGALEMDTAMPHLHFASSEQAFAQCSATLMSGNLHGVPMARVAMLHDSALVIADWHRRGGRIDVPSRPAFALALAEYCAELHRALTDASLLTEAGISEARARIGELDCGRDQRGDSAWVW